MGLVEHFAEFGHWAEQQVGKDADLAIWNAHPLSVYANVDKTFVDGEVFFDRQKDLAGRDQKAKERAELEKAEPNQLPVQPRVRGAITPLPEIQQ